MKMDKTIKKEEFESWIDNSKSTRFIVEPIDGYKISFDQEIEAAKLIMLLNRIEEINK